MRVPYNGNIALSGRGFGPTGQEGRMERSPTKARSTLVALPAPITHAEAAPPALSGPLNPLVGRVAEIEAIRALLAQPDLRLVTLTGAPGIGKTRLALAVAA